MSEGHRTCSGLAEVAACVKSVYEFDLLVCLRWAPKSAFQHD